MYQRVKGQNNILLNDLFAMRLLIYGGMQYRNIIVSRIDNTFTVLLIPLLN